MGGFLWRIYRQDAAANVAAFAHGRHEIDVRTVLADHIQITAAGSVHDTRHSEVLREVVRHVAW
jgi:hypothetical protein